MTAQGFTAYRSPGSGVTAYRLGTGYIDVRFVNGSVYRYTEASVGPQDLAEMFRRAKAESGLSSFIAQVVHDRYEQRLS